MAKLGVKVLLLRSAGFNHVDLAAASTAGISVRRVPAYSPYAVAEMAVGLLLALVRKIPRAYDRVRNHNFNISGLEGFDIHGKTIGLLDSLHHPAICFWRQLPLHMFLRTHAQNRSPVLIRTRTRMSTPCSRTPAPRTSTRTCMHHACKQASTHKWREHTHTHTTQDEVHSKPGCAQNYSYIL